MRRSVLVLFFALLFALFGPLSGALDALPVAAPAQGLDASPAQSGDAAPASLARRQQTRPVHVFLVGDVMLGDLARKTLEEQGYDYPFRALRPLFQGADLI